MKLCPICGSDEHSGLFKCPIAKEQLSSVQWPWTNGPDFGQFAKKQEVNMSDFPLCKRAGLLVEKIKWHDDDGRPCADEFIRADQVEAMLEKAPVVWASPEAVKGTPLAEMWYGDNPRGHTHTARLLMIEPIAKDTAESLLRELINKTAISSYTGKESKFNPTIAFNTNALEVIELIERARRLLEQK